MSQLRMGCSSLNAHLFNLGIIESPMCYCGEGRENTRHFFLYCPLYNSQRKKLVERVSVLSGKPIAIDNLLEGNMESEQINNINIFNAVEEYVINSERFKVFSTPNK
jgi:hypothetical protein